MNLQKLVIILLNLKLNQVYSQTHDPRIMGGSPAEQYEFPYMVQLVLESGVDREFKCGGSILNESIIITAAHCVKGTKRENWFVYANALISDPSWIKVNKGIHQERRISEIISHPCFNPDKKGENDISDKSHDLALLRLDSNLKLNGLSVRKIGLPKINELVGEKVYIIGWGHLSSKESKPSYDLQKLELPTIPLNSCQSKYKSVSGSYSKETISPFMICADGGANDACQGDSGGPLISQASCRKDRYLAGITSFGSNKCGQNVVPGVYVDVSKYVCWILYLDWPADCPKEPPNCPEDKWKDREVDLNCQNSRKGEDDTTGGPRSLAASNFNFAFHISFFLIILYMPNRL